MEGKSEKTEKYHSHPWKWAFSIIFKGGFTDDIEGEVSYNRVGVSVKVYNRKLRHRVRDTVPGTSSWFVGLFRQKYFSPCATVKTNEGYCHYSEVPQFNNQVISKSLM